MLLKIGFKFYFYICIVGDKVIKARAVKFSPSNGCSDLDESKRPILAKGIIAIIERGDCIILDKVTAQNPLDWLVVSGWFKSRI